MAVWGIGAYYHDAMPTDRTNDFLDDGFARIGWYEEDAPALYQMLASIKVGDIIYIKSFVPATKRLYIKAVGIVTDNKPQSFKGKGTGIAVKWIKQLDNEYISFTPEMYRNNVYNNTLYEEFDKTIIYRLIDEIIK